MTKKAMLDEMKASNYLVKENVTSALWNGTCSKSWIESIYENYKKYLALEQQEE